MRRVQVARKTVKGRETGTEPAPRPELSNRTRRLLERLEEI